MGRPEVLSIGYEGRSQQELVDALTAHGVELVVDVRLNPISRKPGLSKSRLTEALAAAGIEYRHAKALGNPRWNRSAFREGKVAEGRDEFRKLLAAPAADSELRRIVADSRNRTLAVLCFEKDHRRCHRQVVIDEVAGREPRVIAYA